MATQDTCCSIYPYFKVREGQLPAFKALCERFVERTAQESKCLYYGFSFDDREVHCREGYVDAEGLLTHLQNVADLLEEALTLAELLHLEVHGPSQELAKLQEPMTDLNPQFFTLEYGFRN